MRKALKEMQHRAQLFVEQAVKYEREAAQHAESIRLKGDSAAMAASAELANVRREAATDAANHKAALASWQGEVDLHKSEAASLKRELERVEHEFGALKEAHKSLEKEKCGIENELNELKKVNCDREKELQADKNAATQTVYQVKEDYERQKDALVEALNEAREKIKLADEAQARISEQLKKARGEGEKLSADLQQTRVSLTQKEEELQKTHGALKQVQDEFEALQKEMEDSHKDNTSVRKQLEEWRQRAADLLSELEKERKVSENLKRSAEEQADTAATREERLKQSEVMYEDTIKAAKKREEELEKERDDLRKALEESKGQYNAVQATVEKMTRELEEASSELTCSQAALASLQQGAAKALIDLENANMRSQKAEEKLATVEKEASEKVARLAQLEGELEALQECTMGLEGGDQKELLSRMVTKIATLEAAVVAADAKRREAHNQLVELKGNIRVFCRVRPHPSGVAQCAADGTTIRVYADSKPYEFVFDRVFKPEVTQSGVFEQIADLVQSALDGYKVCLFSYGQTGAGKTYTMQGGNAPGQEGIIPRSISKILETVETLREQGWDYKLEASFVEVYNEQLRDLLVDGREAGKITENNAIQHLPNGGHTIIQGATRLEIASEYDAADIVNRAAACRAVESTAMNSSSSRSHSIFMLYITGCHEATETMLQGSLNLVDLAGSERLNRSQAEGQRAREACSINKSLSSLGDVFAALSSKQSHIPYRNSKLTHLLQPCLGGSGKTLMFVNINAEPTSAQESLCSLRFASKVNSCETAAKGGALRHASILDKGSRPSMTGRPSIMPSTTGRQSVATARRQSVAPGAASRRTSMIPAAASGVKRKPMGPPPVANPRPRFE
jgi:predicted  nucleic acid-binding Zn-ribbon protein